MPERLGLHWEGVEGRQQRCGDSRGRCVVCALLAVMAVLSTKVGRAVVNLVTAHHGDRRCRGRIGRHSHRRLVLRAWHRRNGRIRRNHRKRLRRTRQCGTCIGGNGHLAEDQHAEHQLADESPECARRCHAATPLARRCVSVPARIGERRREVFPCATTSASTAVRSVSCPPASAAMIGHAEPTGARTQQSARSSSAEAIDSRSAMRSRISATRWRVISRTRS